MDSGHGERVVLAEYFVPIATCICKTEQCSIKDTVCLVYRQNTVLNLPTDGLFRTLYRTRLSVSIKNKPFDDGFMSFDVRLGRAHPN